MEGGRAVIQAQPRHTPEEPTLPQSSESWRAGASPNFSTILDNPEAPVKKRRFFMHYQTRKFIEEEISSCRQSEIRVVFPQRFTGGGWVEG